MLCQAMWTMLVSVLLLGAGAGRTQAPQHEAPDISTSVLFSDHTSLLQAKTTNTSVQRTADSRMHLDKHVLAAAAAAGLLQEDREPETLAALSAELEAAFEAAHENVGEGHVETVGPLASQTAQYDTWAASGTLHTICETGFNAGHSALRFLSGSNAQLFEFDLGAHDYAQTAKAFLTHHFPGRLHVEWGDSTQTLPSFRRTHPTTRCDLLIVDGGHLYSEAMSDLKNFAAMAAPKHILVIDDTPCSAEYCEGPGQAWNELKGLGCITETSSVSMGAGRGFSAGRFTPCAHLDLD